MLEIDKRIPAAIEKGESSELKEPQFFWSKVSSEWELLQLLCSFYSDVKIESRVLLGRVRLYFVRILIEKFLTLL